MCAIGLAALMALIQTLPFECQRWIPSSGKWKCGRGHIFTLDIAPEGGRVLIVEGSTDQSWQKGDRFPVANDAKWE